MMKVMNLLRDGNIWPYSLVANLAEAASTAKRRKDGKEGVREFFDSEQRSVSNFVNEVLSNSTDGPLLFCIRMC